MAATCLPQSFTSIPLRGLEREDITSRTPSRLQILPKTGGAESGADSAKTDLIEPDLAKVVKAWADLPEVIKTAILALVQSSQQTQGNPAGDAPETNTEVI
jgi:hypothetical protein